MGLPPRHCLLEDCGGGVQAPEDLHLRTCLANPTRGGLQQIAPQTGSIMGHTMEQGYCGAGWMALASWNMDIPTQEEEQSFMELEEEVLSRCQDSLEKLEPEAELLLGEVSTV